MNGMHLKTSPTTLVYSHSIINRLKTLFSRWLPGRMRIKPADSLFCFCWMISRLRPILLLTRDRTCVGCCCVDQPAVSGRSSPSTPSAWKVSGSGWKRFTLEFSGPYRTHSTLTSLMLQVQNWILSTADRNLLYEKEITGFDFGYQI